MRKSVIRKPDSAFWSVADPITVNGYEWEAINEHLRKLIEYRLVDASELTLGIFFKRLTDRGRGVLAECDARPPERIGFL